MTQLDNYTMTIGCAETVPDARGNDRRTGRVAALLAAVALILLFLLYIGPRLKNHIPMFAPVAQYIEEHNIEANMYFYTEVEAFSDAQVNMMNTMEHMPGTGTSATE